MADENKDAEVVSILPPELGSKSAETALTNLHQAVENQKGENSNVSGQLVFAQSNVGDRVAKAYVDLEVNHFPDTNSTRAGVNARLMIAGGIDSIGKDAITAALDKLNRTTSGPHYILLDSKNGYFLTVNDKRMKMEFFLGKRSIDNSKMLALPFDNTLEGVVYLDGVNVALRIDTPGNTTSSPDSSNIQSVAGQVPDIIALTGKTAEALNSGLGDSEKRILVWNNPNPTGTFALDSDRKLYTQKGKAIGFVKTI
ncbi:MAG TPA: hypothetical protein VI819_00565 [Patescibacteria group bacterium]|nr:hypothetical protein [Patescibacteria group bacterium]